MKNKKKRGSILDPLDCEEGEGAGGGGGAFWILKKKNGVAILDPLDSEEGKSEGAFWVHWIVNKKGWGGPLDSEEVGGGGGGDFWGPLDSEQEEEGQHFGSTGF